jgi:pyruvate, water dikinase
MTVVAIVEPGCCDTTSTGGKAASLARMSALGLPVPPGFAITADCMVRGLGKQATELASIARSASDESKRCDAAKRAQALVTGTEIEPSLASEIARSYAELGSDDTAVAVRSSACAEDSEAASYAGQQETYLHVRGIDELLYRVRECWASYFSERALFYRACKGSLEDLGMAVVVQRMVCAEVAGVLFTMDPVSRRRDRVVVEAVFGLGEAVVSGEVTPDHYVCARNGEIKQVQVAPQAFSLATKSSGGLVRNRLSQEQGSQRKVADDVLGQLVRIGCDLESQLGCAQDIEWALEDGQIFVLQARPLTA